MAHRDHLVALDRYVDDTHPWPPQCTASWTLDGQDQRCGMAASYVLLRPPDVHVVTPTPVYLPGETLSPQARLRRPYPLYCRAHAYALAGLTLPD